MKVLMVTPYPPVRDGIGAYAVQTVARLRAEGHDVEVLSPWPSAAHHHLDLKGPRGGLALAKRVRRYDEVIVQYHPDVFYSEAFTPRQRAAEGLALFVAFRLARRVVVQVHEIDYQRDRGPTPLALAARLHWRAVDRILVHTEAERQRLAEAFRFPAARIGVTEHGADFRPRTSADRTSARASLGIGEDEHVFLNIGFIQPHKGFDRAVRVFGDVRAAAGDRHARLDIVGSVRTDQPEYLAYLEELRALVERTPGARLHEGFVSDELFDRWLVASDVVVLPYRWIWSSGVLERAALYDRPVIATAVGGLANQSAARPGVILVDDDVGLRRAMVDAVRRDASSEPAGPVRPWPAEGDPLDREAVQDEVKLRAALRRGGPPTATRRPGETRVRVDRSAPVRRLPPLAASQATSARITSRLLKRLVRRLTAWQLDPITHQINALQEATVRALEQDGSVPGANRDAAAPQGAPAAPAAPPASAPPR